MGKHERIVSGSGLPMRRVIITRDDGTDRELWVPDVSDPEVQAKLRADAKRLFDSPGYLDDLAWAEALQADALKLLD